MAARHRVYCINKSDHNNPHERITHVGGHNANRTAWKLTQYAAIQGIKNREWEFYVHIGNRIVDVVVATSRFGNEYLKTVEDGEQPDNLLSLPECK
jgi:hypothetical protein